MKGASALLTLMIIAPSWALADGLVQERDQGIEYYKRKRYSAAAASLDKASKSAKGKSDQRTWYYLAKTHYALTDIEKALPASERAVELAQTDKQKRSAKALLKRINDFFSGVEIRQAADQQGQVEYGYIHLEDAGGLINKKKKKAFKQIRKRFRSTKVRLPATIYLPFGAYTANLAPFEISKGKTAKAETYLYVPDSEAGGGSSVWWYVGGGAIAVVGATAAALLLTAEEPRPERRIGAPLIRLGTPE